jgi:hypothetical protein
VTVRAGEGDSGRGPPRARAAAGASRRGREPSRASEKGDKRKTPPGFPGGVSFY